MPNEREMKVLRELRRNARKQFTKIGEDTDIPVTTVFDYYQKLKKDFIQKEVAILNLEELGYEVKAVVLAEGEELYRYLSRETCVNSLYRLEDGRFLAEAVLRDEDAFENFKEALSSFEPISFGAWKIIEEVKRESFSLV